MTTPRKTPARTKKPAPGFTIERLLRAPPGKVWQMWTTKEGLEKWFGPKGFTSKAQKLELRVGGAYEIIMTARDPQIVEFLKNAGIPRDNIDRGAYAEIVPEKRLAWTAAVDFVPGVAPYKIDQEVELFPAPEGTRMVFKQAAMHDPEWTGQAKDGWTQSFDKLELALG